MIRMIFDKSSAKWSQFNACNVAMLCVITRELGMKYEFRGYIYLNEIYEEFGLKWDPSKENVGWYNDKPLVIDVKPTEDSNETYLITIE